MSQASHHRGDGFDTPLLTQVAGSAANNVYYTTHALISDKSTGLAKKFYDNYKKAYSRRRETAFAALGYDTIFPVADAAKRASSSAPAAMRGALQQTRNLQGVTDLISYTDTSRIPVKGVTIVGVKDDKLFVAGQIVHPSCRTPEP